MCKLLSIFNFKEDIKINKNKMKEIAAIMGFAQKDGLGFYTDNFKSDYLEKGFPTIDIVKTLGKLPPNEIFPLKKFKATEGNFQSVFNFLMMHSRTSTNKKSIDATHPFRLGEKIFAHNGIIQPPKDHGYPVKTVNDSEYFAHVFDDKGYDCLEDIDGYFAFLEYDKSKREITICKDSVASLHFAMNNKTGTTIVSTLEDDINDIIKILGREADWTCATSIEDEIVFKINAEGLHSVHQFESSNWGFGSNSKAFDYGNENHLDDDDVRYIQAEDSFEGIVQDIEQTSKIGVVVTVLANNELFEIPTYTDECDFVAGDVVEFYIDNGAYYFYAND